MFFRVTSSIPMAHPLHEHFRKTPQACADVTHLSPRHKEEPGVPESLRSSGSPPAGAWPSAEPCHADDPGKNERQDICLAASTEYSSSCLSVDERGVCFSQCLPVSKYICGFFWCMAAIQNTEIASVYTPKAPERRALPGRSLSKPNG